MKPPTLYPQEHIMRHITIPLSNIEMIRHLLNDALRMTTKRYRKTCFNKLVRVLRDSGQLPPNSDVKFLSQATDCTGDTYLLVTFEVSE